MVDVSKIKAGDRVKFEARVDHVDSEDKLLPLRVRWANGERTWVAGEHVTEHIPAPREFKIGEPVMVRDQIRRGANVLTVIGVDGDQVWTKWPDGTRATWHITRLCHADEPAP